MEGVIVLQSLPFVTVPLVCQSGFFVDKGFDRAMFGVGCPVDDSLRFMLASSDVCSAAISKD